MTAAYTLCPYRFTPEPPAMITFLEVLGLQTVVRSPSGEFAILEGRAGRVAVHAAHQQPDGSRPVQTTLNVETDDATEAVTALQAEGFVATVWDEAFGHLAGVNSPRGFAVWVNEVMHDTYGYETAEPTPPGTVDVLAVHFSDDFAADADFFAHFGFTDEGNPSTDWRPLSSPGGVIGLHGTDDATSPVGLAVDALGPINAIDLAFETTEALESLVDRLHAAGYADAAIVSEERPQVRVTDPDGITIEIHPSV